MFIHNPRISWKQITIIVSIFCLTGCETMPSSFGSLSTERELTETEKELHDQGDQFNKTVLQGAAVGAIAGALLGALLGGDSQAAAIGAVTGAAAGAAGGYHVAKKQQHYATEEDRINSMIADVSKDNQKLVTYITTTKKYIAESNLRIEEIKKQHASALITEEEIKDHVARLKNNRSRIAKSIESLKESRDQYQYALDEQRSVSNITKVAQLDSEISMLESNINTMESELANLDSVINESPA